MDKILFTKLFIIFLIIIIGLYLYNDIIIRITEVQKRSENSLTPNGTTITEFKNELEGIQRQLTSIPIYLDEIKKDILNLKDADKTTGQNLGSLSTSYEKLYNAVSTINTTTIPDIKSDISYLQYKTANITATPDKTTIDGPLEFIYRPTNIFTSKTPLTVPPLPVIYSKSDGNIYYLGPAHNNPAIEYSLSS